MSNRKITNNENNNDNCCRVDRACTLFECCLKQTVEVIFSCLSLSVSKKKICLLAVTVGGSNYKERMKKWLY